MEYEEKTRREQLEVEIAMMKARIVEYERLMEIHPKRLDNPMMGMSCPNRGARTHYLKRRDRSIKELEELEGKLQAEVAAQPDSQVTTAPAD